MPLRRVDGVSRLQPLFIVVSRSFSPTVILKRLSTSELALVLSTKMLATIDAADTSRRSHRKALRIARMPVEKNSDNVASVPNTFSTEHDSRCQIRVIGRSETEGASRHTRPAKL